MFVKEAIFASLLLSSIHISSSAPMLSAIPDVFKVYQGVTVMGSQVDEKGRLFAQQEKLERLQVLFNDLVFDPPLDTCIEEKVTGNNVYGNQAMSSTFEDVHTQAGFNHVHRPSMAVNPNCIFSPTNPFYNSSKQAQVPNTVCTPEYLTAGAAVGDYNGDGMEDIFFSVFHARSVLYRNNGDGTFTDVTEGTGIGPSSKANGAVWADVDQDGDLDLYVTTVGDTRHYLYINYGGHFSEEAMNRSCSMQTSDMRKLSGMTPNVGDFNKDGFVDIYVTEWIQNDLGQPSVSRLLKNKGSSQPGYFEDVTVSTSVSMDSAFQGPLVNRGTYTFGASFTDFDNDGWQELLVTADYGSSRLFWNTQGTSFSECTASCGLTSANQEATGHAIGDWDNDGRLDWFTASIWQNNMGNALFRKETTRQFTDQTSQAGVANGGWAWGAAFTDFDNDGFQDFILTGGTDFPNTTMKLWQNRGSGQNGSTQEVSSSFGLTGIGQGRGLLKWDYDDDGDEDVVVCNNAGPPTFYQNHQIPNTNKWIKVRAVHRCISSPDKLCDSLGARIQVTMTNSHQQTQEIGSNTHFLGQSSLVAHFGLGSGATPVTVKVTWPRGDRTVTYTAVPVDTRLRVVRPESAADSGKTLAYSTLSSCSSLKLQTIVEQPSKATVAINSDRRTVSLTYNAGVQAADLTTQSFKYTVGLEPSPGGQPLTSTATAVVLFVSSAFVPHTSQSFSACEAARVAQASLSNDRRFDGVSNNVAHLMWGANLVNVHRDAPPMYADGLSLPGGVCTVEQKKTGKCRYIDGQSGMGSNRPSPRQISNEIFHQTESILSARRLSDMHTHWGQFLAHDTDLTNNLKSSEFEGVFSDIWLPIEVPQGDVFFDPQNKGNVYLGFVRSLFNRCTGRNMGTAREQVNEISSYIDGTNVYGQTEARARLLRSFTDGKLKLGPDNNLPDNSMGVTPNHNPFGRSPDTLFAAGDERANEQPALMVLHTIFAREHNRLCDEHKAKNPSASDEEIFKAVRRLVAAELQAITFRQYIPATIGAGKIPAYDGYKESVDAGVSNMMGTAAFRYGHSQVNTHLWRFEENGAMSPYGHLALRDAYFSPERIKKEGGIDPVLRGAVRQAAQETDLLIVDDMRNVLFPGGRDLASLNIQRGRDHGLPDFNSARKALGLPGYTEFSQITSDSKAASKLKELYQSVDNIDLWVGGLAEDHEEGSELGPLFGKIFLQNLVRIRDGDRFWYEDILSKEEQDMVNDLTLGKIIRLNTGFKSAPDNVFFSSDYCTSVENAQCVHKTEPTAAEESKAVVTGLIVACVLIFVIAVILVAVLVYLCYRNKKRSKVTDVKPFQNDQGHTNHAWAAS